MGAPTAAPAPETKVEEKEVPPKRMFPSTDIVHHFHPIAFIRQMMLLQDNSTDECPELVWGKKVSCEFRKRVIQISKRLECDPNHLMTAMALETGGKFDSAIKNSKGYVGLIQFGDDAVKDINKNFFLYRAKITKSYLQKLTAEDQLLYVEYFLHRQKGKLKTLADFYLAVLMPIDVGKGNQKDYVVFDSSLVLNYKPNGKVKKAVTWIRKKGYKANPTFHREGDEYKKNSKGVVYERHGEEGGKTYVWEIAEAIQEWYDKGVTETNNSNTCTCNKDCSCGKDCVDLTNKVVWITQYNKSEIKNGIMNTGGCWRTSQKLLISSGLGKTSGYPKGMITTAKENDTHTSIAVTTDAKAGVEYINTELEKGNPILVGLNHTLNYRFKGKVINEGTTDHYVVIVGRGCKDNKQYYRFYEVGTSYPEKGQHLNNKLFLESDFSLKGNPASNASKEYFVSQVRKN